MGQANKLIRKLGIKLPEKYQWVGSAIYGVLVVVVVTFAMWLLIELSKEAHADEVKDGWIPMGETFLFVERDFSPDIGRICRVTNGDMISNLGADLTIWKMGAFEWHARATHHSCAFGPDAMDYNAIGSGVVIRFNR